MKHFIRVWLRDASETWNGFLNVSDIHFIKKTIPQWASTDSLIDVDVILQTSCGDVSNTFDAKMKIVDLKSIGIVFEKEN